MITGLCLNDHVFVRVTERILLHMTLIKRYTEIFAVTKILLSNVPFFSIGDGYNVELLFPLLLTCGK